MLVQSSPLKDRPVLRDRNLSLPSECVCHEMNKTVGKKKPEKTGLKVQVIVMTRKQRGHVEDGSATENTTLTACKLLS